MAATIGAPVTFIATAEALDDEMAARISTHRSERPPSWSTIEEPLHLSQALGTVPAEGTVVIDCLTLWVANLLQAGQDEKAVVVAAGDLAAQATARAGSVYFLQEYGRELWNVAEGETITVADVEEVRDLVKDQLARTFYGTHFDLASEAEQRYLAAMASLGPSPYPTAEVSKAWGAENQRQTSPHRDSLIQKGLIWSPKRGLLDFTVPLFAEYLVEHHPVSGFGDG